MRSPSLRKFLPAAFLTTITFFAAPPLANPNGSNSPRAPEKGLEPILDYISSGWDTLTRSMGNCATLVDPKLAAKSILYVPADFSIPESVRSLESRCNVQVSPLPQIIRKPGEIDTNTFSPHGLLYLEHPYVVPGGRFNEMYGWDSYFIIRGLVRAGRLELARGMIENFFFEIEHYGAVLNANRSYYLSRSQPPFLSSMILSVVQAQKEKGHEDRAWLERAYQFAVRDHDMWIREPHLAGGTGLSRYYDFGDGPAPESLKDETDHYKKVAQYFLLHPDSNPPHLVERNPGETQPLGVGTQYSLEMCDMPRTMDKSHCESFLELALSRDYYKGDRSMRESGFDISFRFGPYGADTHHFAAVCLNSLLYKTEKDLEEMSRILGHNADGEEAKKRAAEADEWKKRAEARKDAIQKYLWDAQRGEYFDYNTVTQTRSTYEYASAFYPLWTGIASAEQAAAILKNLSHFERPGGLQMSPYDTGAQWDSPFAWAPIQLIAMEGLRRYGYTQEADRMSYNFLSTVAENFRRDGTIREKYNAVNRGADALVKSGYSINVVGFGWTNAVFLEFLHQLPGPMVERLAKEQISAKATGQ